LALHVANYIDGEDDETIIQRRNIVRYMVLMSVLAFRLISPPVRERFPDLQAIQLAGSIWKIHFFNLPSPITEK
jgi:hypothetical protein